MSKLTKLQRATRLCKYAPSLYVLHPEDEAAGPEKIIMGPHSVGYASLLTDDILQIDCEEAIKNKTLLPAYVLLRTKYTFVVVLDVEKNCTYTYELDLNGDEYLKKEPHIVIDCHQYDLFSGYYAARDSDAKWDEQLSLEEIKQSEGIGPSSFEEALRGTCTTEASVPLNQDLSISDLVRQFAFVDTSADLSVFEQIFYDYVEAYLKDPFFDLWGSGELDKDTEFLAGSEAELEELTNLALTVWSKALNLERVDPTVLYISRDCDYDRVELCFDVSDSPVQQEYKRRLLKLLELFAEYNYFSGSHYEYNDGPTSRASGYSLTANEIQIRCDEAVEESNPYLVVEAYEQLINWLSDKVSKEEIQQYLPTSLDNDDYNSLSSQQAI